MDTTYQTIAKTKIVSRVAIITTVVALVVILGSIAAGLVSRKTTTPSTASRLQGRLLLQTEEGGRIWYVNPKDLKRYEVTMATALDLFRSLSLGISNANLAKIPYDPDGLDPTKDSDGDGYTDRAEATGDYDPFGPGKLNVDTKFAQNLKGKLLLQVEEGGRIWYVNPLNAKRYEVTFENLMPLFRKLALGISNANLALIPTNNGQGTVVLSDVSVASTVPADFATYESATINGFKVNYAKINLNNPDLEILTLTASNSNCQTNCPAKPLMDYYNQAGGIIAINGSYFCPTTYPQCSNSTNYYYYPVYNSLTGVLINDNQIRYPTTGPFVAFNKTNVPYFFPLTNQFSNLDQISDAVGSIGSAIANSPLLIYNGQNHLDEGSLDTKQRTVKSPRGFLAVKDNYLYLGHVSGATIIDLKNVMSAMQMTNALNLDGGGSTALIFGGEYKVGPGRNLPNAIVIRKK